MRWSRGSVRRVRDLACLLILSFAAPAAGDIAFVPCQNGNAVSVLDLATGEALAQWDVPGEPAGVALAGSDVVTVSPGSKTVRRLDAASGAALAEVVLDGGPIGVARDPARGRVFISDWYNARIWVLEEETLAVQTELAVGAAPAGLALSDDGRFLASADRDADQVSVFDAQTLDLVHRVDVGVRPFGLRFAPDGRLFVGNVGSNDVTVLGPATGEVLATVGVGERPYGVAFAQGRAFVTNQYENTVSVIALSDLTHEGKIEVGEYPEGIDDNAEGTRIVVANWFDNTISLIDARTLTVLQTLDTADGPRAFGEFVLEDPT